ncbi:BQ5605_C139g13419 [Microbotryum silenes-dioicae]|uniref:BQ5605_C006g04032 protein n=1 Tax=Microbotryum silenes-dioicae TaxID=796604 RepID=A0A2X0MIU5_9BASI|nr:BQ5605_C006g04032 [Microbotryum silenes-dioicae]SGY88460.1 BQ5605_C139g13419 [Microbotryum silenes-dioicae]
MFISASLLAEEEREALLLHETLSLKPFPLKTSLLTLRPPRDCSVHSRWIHWMKLILRQWTQCQRHR